MENVTSIQQYFNTLKWDGRDHIETLQRTINTNHICQKSLLRDWLIIVATSGINRRGSQSLLLICGDQGIGKTTWLNNLCPKYLKEGLFCGQMSPQLDSQKTLKLLATNFIINIDDQIETMSKRGLRQLSVILDTTSLKYRVYGSEFRTANIVASANNNLSDILANNLRAHIIQVKSIDWDLCGLVDIDQVWAHALHLANNRKEELTRTKEVSHV